MFKIAILGLLLGQLALGAPSPQVGTTTCTDSKHWSDGGPSRDVPPGTECKIVNGKAEFVASGSGGDGVVALEATSTLESANPAGTTVLAPVGTTAVTPVVTGTVPQPTGGGTPGGDGASVTPGTLINLADKYRAQMPLGISPSGVATCPAAAASMTASVPSTNSDQAGTRFVAYWSAWHGTGKGILPEASQLKGVTHLILSFWDPNTMSTFSKSENTEWGINIASELKAIKSDMKVMVAVGGWALDEFFRFNATDENRENLAQAFADFVYMYQLDGIDVDWEYPVDHGATYKTTRPNSPCDKDNNVLLMQSIRNKLEALKSDSNPIEEYVLSLAVPAIPGDMLAYDVESATEITKVVDFWNLMTYDYTNRRSSKAQHHAGGGVIKEVVAAYTALNIPKEKLNMGFPNYAKWFSLKNAATDCTAAQPIGCSLGENTFETTAGQEVAYASGTVFFNPGLNTPESLGELAYTAIRDLNVFKSWDTVQPVGVTDSTNHATAAYDEANKIWWTWLTGADTLAACKDNLADVGGIMVWSIDQDNKAAGGGDRFDALQTCIGAT